MTNAVANIGSNTLGLNENWLNATYPQNLNAFQQSSNCIGGWYYGDYWYPYIQYRPVAVPTRIRLKLSEVERLREVARSDEAVRVTLQKFTPYIEIEVDF